MESKLVYTTLAALAFNAKAVTTQLKSEASTSPADVLIGYYTDCNVGIENLQGQVQTLGNFMKLTPSFTFTGIDENCPPMTATVWLEPPEKCEDYDCGTDGYTWVVDPTEVVNGDWSISQRTDLISGDWYVHVTVAPYGFECAIGMVSECSEVNVYAACNAQVDHFTGYMAFNPDKGDGSVYWGPEGLMHNFEFSVSNLWNCDLCATYSLQDTTGNITNSGFLNWGQLYQFSQSENINMVLTSYSSYEDFQYRLILSDCPDDLDDDDTSTVPMLGSTPQLGDEGNYYDQTINVGNPNPGCSLQGAVIIEDVYVTSSGLQIDQLVIESFEYSCNSVNLTSTIWNDDFFKSSIPAQEGNQTFTSTPSTYVPLIWNNFPITVNSTVDVYGDDALIGTFSDTYQYWPECTYSVNAPVISQNITNGTNFTSHMLSISTSNSASIGSYCPDFTGSVNLYHNGEKTRSIAVSSDDMHQFTLSDGTSQLVDFDEDFDDGQWCAEFSITPNHAQPDQEIVTKTSRQVCLEVYAYNCEIEPATSFTGSLNQNTLIQTYTNTARVTFNAWCNPDEVSVSWMTKYMDHDWDWEDVEDDQDYKVTLLDTGLYSYSWGEQESDYEMTTVLQFNYSATTYETQEVLSVMAEAYYQYAETCRPKFAQYPMIDKIVLESDGSLSLSYTQLFAPTGLQNCGEMFATIEVYDDETQALITNMTMDDAQVSQYYSPSSMPAVVIEDIVEQKACFMVRITFGQVGKMSSQVALSSDATCYKPVCELSSPEINLIDQAAAEDGNSFIWTFNTTVVPNKWCSYVNQVACLQSESTGLQWCSDVIETDTVLHLTINQEGAYNETNFTFDATFNSDDSAIAVDSGSFVKTNNGHEIDNCKFSYASNLDVVSDTLETVTIKQNTDVNVSNICGDSSQVFTYLDGDSSSSTPLESHTWTLDSQVDNYCFTTTMTFSNFPQYPQTTDSICVSWIPACQVQVTNVELSFTAAYNVTDTSAEAIGVISGAVLGYCGDEVDVTVTMTGTDGSAYTFDVTDEFYTSEGQTITQEISRTSDTYTLTVTMNANSAQTADEHQATTSGVGFTNIINDSDLATGSSLAPLCSVSAGDIWLVDYEEVNEWRENVLATYSGIVYGEESCNTFEATLRIKNSTTDDFYFNQTNIDLVPTGDGISYTWTQSIEAPNVQQTYVGKIKVQDFFNGADMDYNNTEPEWWKPPCYVEVDNFEKTNQVDSIDGLRTQLSYNVKLAHHGDKACNASSATVSLNSGGIDNFWMVLEDTDYEVALSDDGFDFSIQTEAASAGGASILYVDERAVEDASATAPGFVATSDLVCETQVYDFCLDSVAEVSAGRYAFNFTIRVEHNSQCGALTATMDLVDENQNYFANVAIDGDQIIDVFSCQCPKVFTVYADYDGTPGEVYGQIDIRNGQQNVVRIMDSCTFEL